MYSSLSTVKLKNKLNSYFLAGFVDGEGHFGISITKSLTHNVGWQVQVNFQISINKKDIALLELIKSTWGVGNIFDNNTINNKTKEPKNSILYSVSSLQDLKNVIIPHFVKYPLITQKRADFELFKLIVELMSHKAHLTTRRIASSG